MDGLGRRYAHAPAILLALAATLAAALLLQCVHASVYVPQLDDGLLFVCRVVVGSAVRLD